MKRNRNGNSARAAMSARKEMRRMGAARVIQFSSVKGGLPVSGIESAGRRI
jgi:hypothetical protein